jgi:hypothetical protein
MDWKNEIENLVQRYSSGNQSNAMSAVQDPHQDFQEVASRAPQDVVAGGLAQAFRSDQTPAFPQMLSQLFSNSNNDQRAGLLSRLMSSLPASALGSIPGLSGLAGRSVSPDQAGQMQPEQVQQIAAEAERKNPGIVDEVSNFYAQHPQVVKAAGGLALSIALQHMLKRR